jgi:ribosomal protein S12 methylthiotransferase accessory factor
MRSLNLRDKNLKIKLAPNVSHFGTSDNQLFFIKRDNKFFKISGKSAVEVHRRIFPLLHKPIKIIQIVHSFSDFREQDVINFLREMYKMNLITLVEDKVEKGRKSIIKNDISTNTHTSSSLENNSFKSTLSNSRVLLIGDGTLANRMFDDLKNIGINHISTLSSMADVTSNEHGIKRTTHVEKIGDELKRVILGNDHKLVMVAEDYPNLLLFDIVNEICVNNDTPWLRLSFDDNVGQLGPLVMPRKPPCYRCCQLRLATNSPYYESLLWQHKEHIPNTRLLVRESFAYVLSALCCEEVVRYLAGHEKPWSINNLVIFDTQQMNLSKHKIFPHPECIYCKPYLKQKIQTFSNRTKNIKSGSLSEVELLRRLRDVIDEKTGIIFECKGVYDVNVLGITGHHFFEASCYYPLRVEETTPIDDYLDDDDRVYNHGAGVSPAEAEVRALMETVERYSSMTVDESRLNWATYNDVKTKAINPVDLILYPDKQYEKENFACSKFFPDSVIPWIEGYDIFSGKQILVPADFVYYPPIRNKPLVLESSNGAASHTNLLRAILTGLFEVIERDALLIMWLNKLSMPIIEIENLPYSFNQSLKLINDFGMQVKLIDLTNDTNIPTVMAVCYNRPGEYPALIIGTASHIEPEKAIQKALFEMELLLISVLEYPNRRKVELGYIATPYDHVLFYLNPDMRKYWEFVIASEKRSSLLYSRTGMGNTDDYTLLMQIARSLHNLNYRPIYVDITPSDVRSLGIHVVKTFITGFQPMYFKEEYARYTQRVNTVPERLGYRHASKTAWELNMTPHPLA